MSTSQNSASTSNSIENTNGTLANKLHSAFNTTCEKFLFSIKFSLMKKLYRPIYDKNSKALRNIYDQLCLQLKTTICQELDDVSKEYSLDLLLNSLEERQKNKDPSQLSWRPSGNPEEDLRDHLYPIKLNHKEALQAILDKLRVRNEELINIATVNHAEIMHVEKSNEDLHEKFSNIVTCLTGTNLQNLQKALDDAEMEIQ